VLQKKPRKENSVRIRNWFVTAIFLFAGCSSTPPEKAIINDAATALGGAGKIQAVNTLTISGSGENLNLGQNLSPDAQEPLLKVSEYKRSIDFAGNRSRLEQVRTATVGNTAPAALAQGSVVAKNQLARDCGTSRDKATTAYWSSLPIIWY
jgi:hypothetical protein